MSEEESVLAEFKKHGNKASYHYADDSCKEWGLGDSERSKALKLFNDNPELQSEMRTIAKDFLWTLKLNRPPEGE